MNFSLENRKIVKYTYNLNLKCIKISSGHRVVKLSNIDLILFIYKIIFILIYNFKINCFIPKLTIESYNFICNNKKFLSISI